MHKVCGIVIATLVMLWAMPTMAQAPDTTYLNPYDLVPDKVRLEWFMEQPQTCPDRACVNVVRQDTFRVLANLESVPVAVLANLASGRQCLLWGDLQICRDEFPSHLDVIQERTQSAFYTFILAWNLVTSP